MELPIDLSAEMASEPLKLPSGMVVPIGKINLRLASWNGLKEVLRGLPKTLAIKPLVDINNSPAFAEIAIVRILNAAGWKACWIDSFHKCYRDDMPPQTTSLPDQITGQMQTIRGRYVELLSQHPELRANRGEFGGAWDIVGWKASHMLFVEAKLAGKDRIRPSQLFWLQAGLDAGLSAGQFVIAEWQVG